MCFLMMFFFLATMVLSFFKYSITPLMSYSVEPDLRLADHADADAGQDIRVVITLGESKAERGKTMTITNRMSGRWFEVAIPNGSILIMTSCGSGAQNGLFWHAVDGAEGTYSFCFDMRKKRRESHVHDL